MTPRGDDAEDPVPEDAAVEHGPDTGILCLAMMLQFHKMVADPEQLKHQYALTGTPIAMLGLLRAAKQLGLKALAPTIKPKLGVALYGADRIMFGTDGSDFGAEWSNRAIEEARIEDWKKSHPRRHGGKTTPRLCRTGGIVPGGGITFVPDTPLFCLICTTAAVGGQSRVKYESWNPRACRRR